MTKEELKALGLTDEQIEKIVDDYGRNYVGKNRFNEINEKHKGQKEQIDTMTKQIDNLKKNNADNEQLGGEIDKLKKQIKAMEVEHDAKIISMKKDGLIDQALQAAKVKSVKLGRALLEVDKLEFDGDKLKGLEEQIELAKKESPFMFDVEENSNPSITGYKPGESGNENQSTYDAIESEFESALDG